MSDPVINVTPLESRWQTRDPFLFCVQHIDNHPKGNEPGTADWRNSRSMPFVMNTRPEWERAFAGWPRLDNAPAHPRSESGYARDADGRLERAA